MGNKYVQTYYYEDTNRWKVFDLDVWGNQEDGYDINDFHEICEVTFTDEELDLDDRIIQKLVDLEILTEAAFELTYIDSDYGDMIIRNIETDEPIYLLQMVQVYHRREI